MTFPDNVENRLKSKAIIYSHRKLNQRRKLLSSLGLRDDHIPVVDNLIDALVAKMVPKTFRDKFSKHDTQIFKKKKYFVQDEALQAEYEFPLTYTQFCYQRLKLSAANISSNVFAEILKTKNTEAVKRLFFHCINLDRSKFSNFNKLANHASLLLKVLHNDDLLKKAVNGSRKFKHLLVPHVEPRILRKTHCLSAALLSEFSFCAIYYDTARTCTAEQLQQHDIFLKQNYIRESNVRGTFLLKKRRVKRELKFHQENFRAQRLFSEGVCETNTTKIDTTSMKLLLDRFEFTPDQLFFLTLDKEEVSKDEADIKRNFLVSLVVDEEALVQNEILQLVPKIPPAKRKNLKRVLTKLTDTKIRNDTMIAQVEERAKKLEKRKQQLISAATIFIQKNFRGYIAKKRVITLKCLKMQKSEEKSAAILLQSVVRVMLAKKFVKKKWELVMREKIYVSAVVNCQTNRRVVIAKLRRRKKQLNRSSAFIQSFFRLVNDRAIYKKRLHAKRFYEFSNSSAIKVQKIFRGFRCRLSVRVKKKKVLCANIIQKIFRGYWTRRMFVLKLRFSRAKPGKEKKSLGLELINQTQQKFKMLSQEIEFLNSAQNNTALSISQVSFDLGKSESSLKIIEEEMKSVIGKNTLSSSDAVMNKQRDEPYRMEKKQTTSVSDVVNFTEEKVLLRKKFKTLKEDINLKQEKLNLLGKDMDNFERLKISKEKSFSLLEKNLCNIIDDQEHELKHIRTKNHQIEQISSAVVSDAEKVILDIRDKEQEQSELHRSAESMLRFQFLSTSASYLNSMKLFSSLKENDSKSRQAILSSAINMSKSLLASERIESRKTSIKNNTLKEQENYSEQPKPDVRKYVLPLDVTSWSVNEVCYWLSTLALNRYAEAFKEGAVDGNLLIELNESVLKHALGVNHELHRKKILSFRENAMSLASTKPGPVYGVVRDEYSASNMEQKRTVLKPTSNFSSSNPLSMKKKSIGIFSQIRNGKLENVESALDNCADIDETDIHGNTGLIVSTQNLNKDLIRLFLNRGADINQQNKQGNTALHYAFAYEPKGTIAEYLIAMGADDTIENMLGYSPYEGID